MFESLTGLAAGSLQFSREKASSFVCGWTSAQTFNPETKKNVLKINFIYLFKKFIQFPLRDE